MTIMQNISTHFDPVWRDSMYGVWATDKEGFGNKRDHLIYPCREWEFLDARPTIGLKINKNFRGFGGEEGYIHEKFRQNGRKRQCVPSHNSNGCIDLEDPSGVPYSVEVRRQSLELFHWMVGDTRRPQPSNDTRHKESFHRIRLGKNNSKQIVRRSFGCSLRERRIRVFCISFPRKRN
jgi:hypothetical protein